MLATLLAFSITAPLLHCSIHSGDATPGRARTKWLEGPPPWLKALATPCLALRIALLR